MANSPISFLASCEIPVPSNPTLIKDEFRLIFSSSALPPSSSSGFHPSSRDTREAFSAIARESEVTAAHAPWPPPVSPLSLRSKLIKVALEARAGQREARKEAVWEPRPHQDRFRLEVKIFLQLDCSRGKAKKLIQCNFP